MGFGVWGLGFRVYGLFRIQELGYRVQCRVRGLGFGFRGLGYMGMGYGFRV